jgi:sigma-E factor negative regulatory protein RseC
MAMITETARVVAVEEDGHAWVETQRKAACDSCSVQKGCGSGVLSRMFSGKRARLRVVNVLGAAVGDEVVVGIEDSLLVRSSLAVYLMPLVWLLLGAIGGGMVAEVLQPAHVDGISALGGLLGLACGFWWLRRYARAAARDSARQPSLIAYAGSPGIGAESRVAVSEIERPAAGGGGASA